MRLALARYPLARNAMPDPFVEDIDRDSEKLPAASTKDYVRWQRGAHTKTPMKTMEEWVDKAVERDNVWLVLVFHGVDGVGWEPKSRAELEEYFAYIKAKQDKVWVATFQDAGKYMRERMATKLTSRFSLGELEVTLTHQLDPALYDLPLTLKTRVPDAWKSVKIEHRGHATTVSVSRDGVGPFVVYHAWANMGSVVLREAK
jgi:hypothetical protein